MNTFVQQGHIQSIKSDSEETFDVTNHFDFIKELKEITWCPEKY